MPELATNLLFTGDNLEGAPGTMRGSDARQAASRTRRPGRLWPGRRYRAVSLLAIFLALTACSTTVVSTFEVVASPSGIVPSVSASSSGPLEGRWATGPIPIADIRAAMITAGITAADVDAWVTEVGSPSQYSFVLEFTGQTFAHSGETPSTPMEVDELGAFSLSGTELVLTPGEAGNIDTYTLDASLSGDELSLRWVASTEEGTAEAKETHRRFTIAFYCSAVFKRG